MVAIHGSLKANGTLFVHTPNLDYIVEHLKQKGILPQVGGHVAVRNVSQYRSMLRAGGFSQIESKLIPHYLQPGRALHFLSYLPFVGRYCQARLFLICSK